MLEAGLAVLYRSGVVEEYSEAMAEVDKLVVAEMYQAMEAAKFSGLGKLKTEMCDV
jgi:hypothetical protein